MAISTNGTVLTRLFGGLYNQTLSNASYSEAVATVRTTAEINAFANDLYARDAGGLSDMAVANTLLANLNLSSVAGLNNWVSAQLTAAGTGNKGAKLISMLNDFANMTADATYGSYATAFNAKVNAALVLAQTPGSIGSDFSVVAQPGTQVLTASIDTLTGNKFTSTPTYTPGGNDFVNTLQDEDTLTGTGTNPTLSVTLGSVNDAAESTIVPKLNGIETVAIQSTGSTSGINFQDATGLKTLTVDRITQNNAGLTLSDIAASAATYNLNNATRAGAVTFASKEEVLTGTAETLAVNVNSSRASALNLTEGTDGGADAGYYYETVNMTTTGNNDLDAVTVSANGMEDTLLSLTAGTTTQTLNIVANGTTASGYLEINNLTASGVETMTIAANARVDIAANKMVALAAGNDGISTADLETLTITGAANVMIDGLDTAKLATRTLTVNAGAMTGDLKLGVATASDASSSGTYATRTDKDLSVTSGSGNDQIVTYTTLAGDITTNAGNDVVRVGNATTAAASLDAEGVSTITTGEGNDTVVAKDLLVTANDQDQTTNTNFDDVTAATISTGAGNDSVTVGSLTNRSDWDNITLTDSNVNDQQFVRGASISTDAGTDSVTFTTIAEGASISTGDDADTVTVSLVAANATILAGDTDADVVSVVDVTHADTGDSNPASSATYTNEVSTLGVADRLGAVVDAGAGNDTISFTDATSLDIDSSGADIAASNTIVARDALLAGGAGTDTLSITTLDTVTVTTATSMADQDGTLTDTQTDINANVTGVETLNLTVADQVVNFGDSTATLVTSGLDKVITFGTHYYAGEVVTVSVGGEPYSYTVPSSGASGTIVANAIAALINADQTPAGNDPDLAGFGYGGGILTIHQSSVTSGNNHDGVLAVATSTANAVTRHPYATGNDNSDADGAFTADVLRFDADLTAINMTSQEQILETGPATEYYVPGTATSFTLNNLRETVTTLTLSAHEATGVNTATGALRDDTLLSISSSTGVVTTNSAAKDVDLTMNWDASSETNDAAAISIGAPAGALSGNFDVLFTLGAAATDTTDNATYTADTTDRLENFTVNVTDGNSHSFNFYNGYGDANWGSNATNGTNAAVTSLTVNTGGAAVQVDGVGTDRIAFNNAAGTGVTAANVTLRVNQANNFTITTGSGTDIVDMRADDVRSYDTATTGGADNINLGTGRDTLIISAGDSLGKNNNINVGTGVVGTSSTIIDDDVFATVLSAERILVDTTGNGTNMITLDEQAGPAGVDTIVLLGAGNQETSIVIGNNFVVPTGTDNSNGQTTGAASALVIDASTHTGDTTLNIENKDDDSDIAVVNMDVRANATSGAEINFVGTGSLNSAVQVTLTTTATATSTNNVIASSATGTTDGSVDINVLASATNAIDKIILLEGAVDASTTVAGLNAIEGSDTITIEDDWTGAAFELDASALLNTDLVAFGNTSADTTGATGGATITVERADTAALTISGTQNSDSITTGRAADVVYGNDGNDTIVGDEVTNNAELEVVTFAATYDSGDQITVTHNGNTATAIIGADGVTGTAVASAFADFLDGTYAGVANITFSAAAATWASATAAASGTTANLRLTGATAGTDYVVTASTNNTGDNVAQVQTLAVGANAAAVTLVFNGVTYAIADSNSATDTALVALSAAVAALGGALTTSGVGIPGNDSFIVTGPSTGAAFPFITQTSAGALSLTSPDLGTDQANPTVETETLARSVIGGADTINGGNGDDDITGLVGADVLDGGAGNDTVNYQLSLAAVNVNLATNVVSGGDAQGDVISNFENITGTVYADTLTGSSAANTIDGGAGNDTISTGDGSDAITAGEGADSVNGGNGVDIITLTETTSAADRVTSDATVEANADRIVGFATTVDKFQYTGTLQNALGTNSDGIAGTDVVTGVATMTLAMADANSTAGVVFDISGLNISGTTSDALFAATTATAIGTAYTAFEAALIASGTLSGTITNLDSVLNTTDSVLVVLHDSTGGTATTAGSVVLRITNSDTSTANTLTAAEVELVGVFANTQLVAADFI